MITCWHCTTSLLDGTIFCDGCGAALLPDATRRTAAPLGHRHECPSADERPIARGEPRLVIDASGESIVLPSTTQVVVGRVGDNGPAPDVDLGPFRGAAAGVSRAHAVLDLAGPRPQIEDLNSTNGTYVNGRRLQPRRPVPLSQGDRIYLGGLALRLEM